jgi:hypothetical protein
VKVWRNGVEQISPGGFLLVLTTILLNKSTPIFTYKVHNQKLICGDYSTVTVVNTAQHSTAQVAGSICSNKKKCHKIWHHRVLVTCEDYQKK